MTDYLLRATAAQGQIRAVVAVTTALVDEARRRHGAFPTAAAALGRALTAAGLLSATLKDEQSITLRFAGSGPLGGPVAEATAAGHVRGYVRNPEVDLPLNAQGKLDVGGAVGRSGFLHVAKDLGLKEAVTGTTKLVNGEIAEDLTYYLTASEQTPSAVGLGVLVDPDGTVRAAGGFLVQLLPGASDAVIDQLEANLGAFGAVSTAVDQGNSPEQLLERLLGNLEPKPLERTDLSFTCSCSRARAKDALAALSPAELRELIEEDHGAELTCHVCREVYQFAEAELRALPQYEKADPV